MFIMVLSILIAAITAPGLLGSQEAIRQGQSKERREEHRARRCNLIATCIKPSLRSKEIDGRPVVLRNDKLWIDTTTKDGQPFGHTYAGYYLPYPDTKYEGLVTTITDIAPVMNWVYVDKETYEVKYGVRADAQGNFTVPFDCTRQDRRLTFDGWEGWCAVEEYEGYWCLYFDVDDDGLKSKIAPGVRVLEIELSRKEKRFKKEKEARQQDQTTKRTVDAEDNTPVDIALQQEPEVKRPGVFCDPISEPRSTHTDDTIHKTPPPAYSKPANSELRPSLDRPKNGAVDALDDLLATEAQTPDAIHSSPGQPKTKVLQRVTLGDGKRHTQKLNRNSGSKAIAQAQMFETMAAAQLRNDTFKPKETSGTNMLSRYSSRADSKLSSPKEDQRQRDNVHPSSTIPRRAKDGVSTVIPVVPTPFPQSRLAVESNDSISQKYQFDDHQTDPAIFGASIPFDRKSKRDSRADFSTQQKRKSRTFTARRPGKRVSPRSSMRKSLIETGSGDTTKKRLASSSTSLRSLKVPSNDGRASSRTQAGRKTTSTIIRDLDNMISQELGLPESGLTNDVAKRGLPPKPKLISSQHNRVTQRSVKRR